MSLRVNCFSQLWMWLSLDELSSSRLWRVDLLRRHSFGQTPNKQLELNHLLLGQTISKREVFQIALLPPLSSKGSVPADQRVSMDSSSTQSMSTSHYESQSEVVVSGSFDRSVSAADTTLHQLITAKETFTDLAATCKKFKYELESVKEEHNIEVSARHESIKAHPTFTGVPHLLKFMLGLTSESRARTGICFQLLLCMLSYSNHFLFLK